MNKIFKPLLLSLLIALLVFVSFCNSSVASTVFSFSPNKKIEVVIAAGVLNRIKITNGEVMEVIGDENKYSLYWSGDWRNLFIKPKVEVGETIELSLITSSGDAQDMRFTVGDLLAQTIFINMGNSAREPSPVNGNFYLLSDPELKLEISSMMRAMIEGVKSKYYITGNKRILQQTKQQLITQEKAYRYKNLSGAVLTVKNLTSKSLALFESDFKNLLKNCIAINLSSSVIGCKGSAQVFIVTREAHHD